MQREVPARRWSQQVRTRSNGSGPRPASTKNASTSAPVGNSRALPKRRLSRKPQMPRLFALGPAFQWEDQVRVGLDRGLGRDDRELPGHAKMDDEGPFAIEAEDDPLAAPLDSVDDLAAQLPVPLRLPGRAQRQATGPNHQADAPAGHHWPQVADHCFDFGQFGHGAPREGRRTLEEL